MNNELKQMYSDWRRRMASSYAPPDYSCAGPAIRRHIPHTEITESYRCAAAKAHERKSIILWLVNTAPQGMYMNEVYKLIKYHGFEGTCLRSISKDLHALFASGYLSRTEERTVCKRYRYRRTTKIWN